MYVSGISMENTGPIEELNIEFPIIDKYPKPIILVGENGSGKSIVLSYIMNSIMCAQQASFDNPEVDTGKVYKIRSPSYIKSGKLYSYGEVRFDDNTKDYEWQLQKKKSDFLDKNDEIPKRLEWQNIPKDEFSFLEQISFSNIKHAEAIVLNQCCLYFPVGRFEEPGWLNSKYLKTRAILPERKNFSRLTLRNIICHSTLQQNRDWILDILMDRYIYEMNIEKIAQTPPYGLGVFDVFRGYSGRASDIYDSINRIIRIILNGDISMRIGVSARQTRRIAVMKGNAECIPDIFQLSTGEVQLLNIFLSIIRDFDYTNLPLNSISDISGIVIIDEIDAHLHTSYQREILPELISSFPKVQFIITSHSPLFLLGLKEKIGDDNFFIYNLPHGKRVFAEDFSEVTSAYDVFKKTQKYRDEIIQAIEESKKPVVFVEGAYDIKYIKKAANFLGQTDILDKINLYDGGGFGGLKNIWTSFNNPAAEALSSRTLLLFDCDIKQTNKSRGKFFSTSITTIVENPIRSGIENLFSMETVNKIIIANNKYIDVTEEHSITLRGKSETIPKSFSVNKDEKGNLCQWLCENGDNADFRYFSNIFELIQDFISRK